MTQQNLPELLERAASMIEEDYESTTKAHTVDGVWNDDDWSDGVKALVDEQKSVVESLRSAALAALSSQGAGGAVALSEAESALDKLDQWLLDRCPGGPWVALEPLGVIREYIKASRLQASLPTDLVPLRIEYEPGYPEDVAFGTQMQMDRLKKWLDKFFAMRAAEAAQPPIQQAMATCPNCNGSGSVVVMSDASPDAHEVEVECPHCAGTGALDDAYQGVVKLLQQMTAKWYQALPFEVAHHNKSNEAAQPALTTADAMKVVIDAMRAEPDYAWSWHCNVAMAFVDEGGDHALANHAAARFMKLLANVEPAHELPARNEAAQPARVVDAIRERLAQEECCVPKRDDKQDDDFASGLRCGLRIALEIATTPAAPAICGMPVVVDESMPAGQIEFVQPATTPSQAGEVTELEVQLSKVLRGASGVAYLAVIANRYVDEWKDWDEQRKKALAAFKAKKAGKA